MRDFIEAIRAADLEPPEHIVPGKLHRFPGADKRRGNKAAWCKLFEDGLGGVFGDFSTGLEGTWQAKRDYADAETAAFKHSAEHQRQETKETAEKDRQKEKALKRWQSASPINAHPYLAAKGVKAHGLRTSGRNLLIPLWDINGAFQGLQWIGERGHKGFSKGSNLQGSYFPIGQPNGWLIICEGYATGATIHEVMGHAVAIAFNAGNLKAVAEGLRKKYPDLEIVIAADNDQWTEGNPGLRYARQAAEAVGGAVVIPQFTDTTTHPTDFNDLHQREGAQEVRRQLNPNNGNHEATDEDHNMTTEDMATEEDYTMPSYESNNGYRGNNEELNPNNIKLDQSITSITSSTDKGYRGNNPSPIHPLSVTSVTNEADSSFGVRQKSPPAVDSLKGSKGDR